MSDSIIRQGQNNIKKTRAKKDHLSLNSFYSGKFQNFQLKN
jgi:hypothetical protein